MTDTPDAVPESPIPPHRLSAERLLASAGAIRSFASAYLDVLDDDDGWRALVYVDDGIEVRSRTGRNVTSALPELAGVASHFTSNDQRGPTGAAPTAASIG